MDKNNLPGLSPLWLIALALALGTSIVTLIPLSIAGADTIKLSDWIGFSGSIVGACIALLAAFIAYSAIREQTRSAERVALQREAEALEVLKADLYLTLQIINQLWKWVDSALESQIDENRRRYRLSNAILNFHLLPDKRHIENLRRNSEGMMPVQRYRFIAVGVWFDACDSFRPALDRGPEPGEPVEFFQTRIVSLMQTTFTALANAVERFDPELVRVFDGRKRSDRFGLTMNEQLNVMFETNLAAERQMFGDGK